MKYDHLDNGRKQVTEFNKSAESFGGEIQSQIQRLSELRDRIEAEMDRLGEAQRFIEDLASDGTNRGIHLLPDVALEEDLGAALRADGLSA